MPVLRLSKNKFGGNARIGAGVTVAKKRAQNEKFYSIFFKKSRDWKGHEPRCPDSIRTPEKTLAGHTARPAFPASGKPRFFTGCTSITSPCLSPFFRRTPTPENCGFVLCTKCGPCHTARKQFSKGLRSKTGVQQHSKNTQKRLFRQAERGRETPPAPLFYRRRPFTPGQSQPQSFGGKNSFTGKRIFLNSSQGSSAEAETHSFSGMQKS